MKRPDTIKIDASKVQGEGAFIEVKRLTWGERKQLQEQFSTNQMTAMKIVVERLSKWNWVGSDGEPLPLPKTEEDLDCLYDEEITFLADTIADSLKGRLEFTQETEKN